MKSVSSLPLLPSINHPHSHSPFPLLSFREQLKGVSRALEADQERNQALSQSESSSIPKSSGEARHDPGHSGDDDLSPHEPGTSVVSASFLRRMNSQFHPKMLYPPQDPSGISAHPRSHPSSTSPPPPLPSSSTPSTLPSSPPSSSSSHLPSGSPMDPKSVADSMYYPEDKDRFLSMPEPWDPVEWHYRQTELRRSSSTSSSTSVNAAALAASRAAQRRNSTLTTGGVPLSSGSSMGPLHSLPPSGDGMRMSAQMDSLGGPLLEGEEVGYQGQHLLSLPSPSPPSPAPGSNGDTGLHDPHHQHHHSDSRIPSPPLSPPGSSSLATHEDGVSTMDHTSSSFSPPSHRLSRMPSPPPAGLRVIPYDDNPNSPGANTPPSSSQELHGRESALARLSGLSESIPHNPSGSLGRVAYRPMSSSSQDPAFDPPMSPYSYPSSSNSISSSPQKASTGMKHRYSVASAATGRTTSGASRYSTATGLNPRSSRLGGGGLGSLAGSSPSSSPGPGKRGSMAASSVAMSLRSKRASSIAAMGPTLPTDVSPESLPEPLELSGTNQARKNAMRVTASATLTTDPLAMLTYRENARRSGDPALQLSFAKYLLDTVGLAAANPTLGTDGELEAEAIAEAQGLDGPDIIMDTRRKEMLIEAIYWIDRLARAGDGEGSLILGTWLEEGIMGKRKNDRAALRLYMVASKAGIGAGTWRAATMQERKGDISKAVNLYKKAAKQGSPQANYVS